MCSSCGKELQNGRCPACGWTHFMVKMERGITQEGEVIVPTCLVGSCVSKNEDTTFFCKFLQKFSTTLTGNVLVWCDPQYDGEVEQ